jgi:hypothetical protein
LSFAPVAKLRNKVVAAASADACASAGLLSDDRQHENDLFPPSGFVSSAVAFDQ